MHSTQNKKIGEKIGQLRKKIHFFCDKNILNNVSITQILERWCAFGNNVRYGKKKVVLHLLRGNISRRRIKT